MSFVVRMFLWVVRIYIGQCAYSLVFFFKQKTAYEMRISDWSSDVCSSDLKDHIADGEAEPGTLLNAVGLVGPRDIAHEIETRLKAGEGEPFRLYDDDGELYYEGRIIGDHTGWDGFTPLDD